MYANGDQPKILKEGFSLLDIKRFLATQVFTADGFKLPLQKLADAKLPAIVLEAEKGYHHLSSSRVPRMAASWSATRSAAPVR